MLIRNPPTQIVDGLWMLGTNEYPLYLLRCGEEAAVFEGGTGAMGPVLSEQLEQTGVAPGAVKQLIVTHAHPDHVMAVPMLRELFPAVTVLAGEVAVKTLAAEKAVAFFGKIDQALTGALLEAGSIEPRHQPAPLGEATIGVDRVLGQGDTVVVGAATFNVLATPGHSPCSLSFHEPGARILLISDATGYYMPEHEAWWPNYFDGYGAYVESMRRLAELDADVLCLSHNAVVTGADDVRAYFSGAIAATEEYHKRIVDALRGGTDPRQLAEQLGNEVHEKTQLLPAEFFQKNCGLMVKLSMKHEGIGQES